MRNVADGLPSEMRWPGPDGPAGIRSRGSVRPGPLGLDGVSVDRGADLLEGDRAGEGLVGPRGAVLRGRWFGHRRADLVRAVVVLALGHGSSAQVAGDRVVGARDPGQ